MIIADTDVLIDFLNDKEPSASRVSLELEKGELRTTVITRFELLSGTGSEKQKKAVSQLLEAIPALPLDAAAADKAAQARHELEKHGQGIGMGDSLIVGIVLQNKGTLLTRNQKHFSRVKGLHLGHLTSNT
ncbi:MAG TPA: type II toxin-antitoxin system VapC family toxin [bacterium]|nr:type II toxin-antitoxin system VapC family toxin [bacterium]